MIDYDLEHQESIEVDDLLEIEGVENGDQIEKTDVVIKSIGQSNEKVSLFRNLEEEGDGQKEGQDDDSAEHQPLHAF